MDNKTDISQASHPDCPTCKVLNRQDKMAALRKKGYSYADIGRQLGTTRQSVFRSLERRAKREWKEE